MFYTVLDSSLDNHEMNLVLWTWLRTLKTAAEIAACSKMAVKVDVTISMVAKVAVKKIGYDLGSEDRCELGCNLGMSDGYKFVQKKKEQRMQTQSARRNARVSTQHRPTQTSLHTNE